jgi:hypothetical protein
MATKFIAEAEISSKESTSEANSETEPVESQP